MTDEFYIGWETEAAPGVSRTTRKVALGLLLLAVLLAVVVSVSQRMIGQNIFEWGTSKSFSGILKTKPYPHLLMPRPGNAGGLPQFSSYYLVAPWKFGLDSESVAAMNGVWVTLKGSLIYNGHQAMIETKEQWIHRSPNSSAFTLPESVSLGQQSLIGEIVDSKCFLGVMNPGQWTPHRACAIRCISGGVPPLFVIRHKNAVTSYLMLVSVNGQSVNQQVLDFIGEPVEITGEVIRQGDLLILRADPSTYRRVN